MADTPDQAEATPEQVEDPSAAAQRIVNDPAMKNTPEWLAAMQLLADEGKAEHEKVVFSDLEKEMQALKGMSEI